MIIDILSLFPGYFQGPFNESIIKRAREKGIVDIRLIDIRDFADNRYHRVDDRPYGGGPGMVMMPQPVTAAIRQVKNQRSRVIYLTPQGSLLNAAKCRELAREKHLILLCGHYEGIDQRALDQEVNEEISIGDYVLTNGCLAAIVIVDALVRFIPGVLGHACAAKEDSFEEDLFEKDPSKHKKRLLEGPLYTRPRDFEGHSVPDILLNGHHQEIAKWRWQQALKKTYQVRPDLLG